MQAQLDRVLAQRDQELQQEQMHREHGQRTKSAKLKVLGDIQSMVAGYKKRQNAP